MSASTRTKSTKTSRDEDADNVQPKRSKEDEDDDQRWVRFTLKVHNVCLDDPGNVVIVVREGHRSRVRIDTRGYLGINNEIPGQFLGRDIDLTDVPLERTLYKSSTTIKFNDAFVDISTIKTKVHDRDSVTIYAKKKIQNDPLVLVSDPKSLNAFLDGDANADNFHV